MANKKPTGKYNATHGNLYMIDKYKMWTMPCKISTTNVVQLYDRVQSRGLFLFVM